MARRRRKATVTGKQIAEALGVSQAAVSLVLNDRADEYGLSSETQARVRAKAAELGYRKLRRLRRDRTLLVAVPRGFSIVGARGFPYLLLNRLMDELAENGWQIAVLPHTAEGRFEIPTRLLARSTAIVIPTAAATVDQAKELAERAREQGVTPLILGRLYADLDALCVDGSNYGGGRLAAEHLHALGHKDVAVVKGITGDAHTEDRLRGFLDFFAENDLPVPDEMIWGDGDYWHVQAHRITLEKLRAGLRPTAIFYMSDGMALGGLYALREAKLSVPADVSVVGYDDAGAQDSDPPLTTVRIDAGDIGRHVGRILLDMLRSGSSQRMQVLCPVRLVVRSSTGPAGAAVREAPQRSGA